MSSENFIPQPSLMMAQTLHSHFLSWEDVNIENNVVSVQPVNLLYRQKTLKINRSFLLRFRKSPSGSHMLWEYIHPLRKFNSPLYGEISQATSFLEGHKPCLTVSGFMLCPKKTIHLLLQPVQISNLTPTFPGL